MTIYVVLGILKGDDDGFTEILKAFTLREKADNYCRRQINKSNNPYKEVSWQQTELTEMGIEAKYLILKLQNQFDIIKLRDSLNKLIDGDTCIGLSIKWIEIAEMLREAELKET